MCGPSGGQMMDEGRQTMDEGRRMREVKRKKARGKKKLPREIQGISGTWSSKFLLKFLRASALKNWPRNDKGKKKGGINYERENNNKVFETSGPDFCLACAALSLLSVWVHLSQDLFRRQKLGNS
jgi:hypothetical protein